MESDCSIIRKTSIKTVLLQNLGLETVDKIEELLQIEVVRPFLATFFGYFFTMMLTEFLQLRSRK